MASPFSVDPSDFVVKKYIQEGAMGKVFAAVRKSTGKNVAMKFFGYTSRTVGFSDIEKEIHLLISLKGIEGIVQLEGVFLDTDAGMLPGKKNRGEFPVIVMELIEGGELFDRINTRVHVSESDLAKIFMHIVVAVESIHERRFIHRDLKLENLMLMSNDDDSKVKIIDFGMMVKLPNNADAFVSAHLQGTAGYYAPEFIMDHEYSYKTDIWQLGCILYSMLSGLPPYNPKYPRQITHFSYIPMVGEGWENISDSAKDLVAKILVRNKSARLSSAEILRHPWLSGMAPSTNLGSDYFTRIKHLSLRQKFKTFFLEHDITEGNKARKAMLCNILPFLKEDMEKVDSSEGKDLSLSVESLRKTAFQDKLVVLRALMIEALLSKRSRAMMDDSSEVEKKIVRDDIEEPLEISNEETAEHSVADEVDYEVFTEILRRADLMELANPVIFNIFDIGNTKTIDLKEFLITMLAFRPDSTDADPVRLYFNIFDITGTGYIDIDELRVCIECLLMDNRSRLKSAGKTLPMPSIEEVFRTMDFTNNGRIDFDEFSMFYEAVLSASNTTV